MGGQKRPGENQEQNKKTIKLYIVLDSPLFTDESKNPLPNGNEIKIPSYQRTHELIYGTQLIFSLWPI